VEAEHVGAVGAGAFGKEQDGDSGFEEGFHLAGGSFGAGSALAIDKDGASAARKKTEGRPAAHFLLGDEDAGCCGGIDEDVKVAEVIGANQAIRGAWSATLEAHAYAAQDDGAGLMQPLSPLRRVRVGTVPKAKKLEPESDFSQAEEKGQ
jgi:hypothetical protein